MNPRRKELFGLIGGVFITLVVWSAPELAHAQRRLHERVIAPNEETSPLVEQPAEGRNPAALRLPDVQVAEPNHSTELREGEQSFQATNTTLHDGQPRALDQWRPDLQTARTADELPYHSSFVPSISPHKRLGVLDQVGADYTLSLSSPTLQEVPVRGQASEDRDLFWGSVAVRFVPDRPVPIPSVAPEARILSVRTRPSMPVRFFRDGAGNYSVASSQTGRCRIVFVTDAPATYFGGPLPSQVRASDVPANLRPSLPPNVARAATQVAQRLGLDPGAPIARNLPRLVTYLRSFETLPLEAAPPGADPYLTLAFGRRGVCRHRAFVFVVTAQGLGLPARFVTNEVHAFSEVYVPTVGWIRIDLGGEARLAPESEPTVHHEPRSSDPFPWPPGSQTPPPSSSGHGAPTAQGPSQAGQAEGQESESGEGAEGSNPDSNQDERAAEREGRQDPNAEARQIAEGSEGSEGGEIDPTIEGVEGSTPTDSPEALPPSRRLSVILQRHSATVVRGEALPISGLVRDAEGPVPGARVTVFIRGRALPRPRRLGQATCGTDGRFEAHFAVPSSVPTGDYVITANAEQRE